jgi:hypothetical protein
MKKPKTIITSIRKVYTDYHWQQQVKNSDQNSQIALFCFGNIALPRFFFCTLIRKVNNSRCNILVPILKVIINTIVFFLCKEIPYNIIDRKKKFHRKRTKKKKKKNHSYVVNLMTAPFWFLYLIFW